MNAQPLDPAARGRRRPRPLLLLIAAMVIGVGALVALGSWRAAAPPAPAADCEEKPPPYEFAVAECDAGAEPGRAPAAATPDR